MHGACLTVYSDSFVPENLGIQRSDDTHFSLFEHSLLFSHLFCSSFGFSWQMRQSLIDAINPTFRKYALCRRQTHCRRQNHLKICWFNLVNFPNTVYHYWDFTFGRTFFDVRMISWVEITLFLWNLTRRPLSLSLLPFRIPIHSSTLLHLIKQLQVSSMLKCLSLNLETCYLNILEFNLQSCSFVLAIKSQCQDPCRWLLFEGIFINLQL